MTVLESGGRQSGGGRDERTRVLFPQGSRTAAWNEVNHALGRAVRVLNIDSSTTPEEVEALVSGYLAQVNTDALAVVCTGVGIATSIAIRSAFAGLIAMLCAPLAIAVARSSQKILASLVGAAGQPALLSIGTISTLKAIEYGLLGWLLARLVQRDTKGPFPYLGAGAGVGLLFGGAITVLTYQVGVAPDLAPEPAQIIGTALNELLFPIGCAVVIYIGQVVGRNVAGLSSQTA